MSRPSRKCCGTIRGAAARVKEILTDDPDATPGFGFDNACALPADFIQRG
jgi:hypothetical protein